MKGVPGMDLLPWLPRVGRRGRCLIDDVAFANEVQRFSVVHRESALARALAVFIA